jgi:hypothetical protein
MAEPKSRVQLALELGYPDYDPDARELSERIANSNQTVALANVLLHLADDIQARQAAAPAPSALAELRAVPGATGANRTCDHHAAIHSLNRELTEAREALARVEAERDDELKRKLATTAWLLWDVRTKSRSELEEANWDGRADEWLDVVLPGKAASEAEAPAMSPRELIERFALCHHDIQMRTCPKCRSVPVAPGTLVVGARYRITEIAPWDETPRMAVGDEWTPACDADCVWKAWGSLLGKHKSCWALLDADKECTWVTGLELVSDPETTESAPREG